MTRPITDLLDGADRLLNYAGQHPEKDAAFRQSAISQAAGLTRESLRRVTEQQERIRRLADRADSYLGGLSEHTFGCKVGFEEIKAEARALYRELGGTD